MRILLLRDCCDFDVIYGVIILKDEKKSEKMQEKIYEIKNTFNNNDWCIDNVLEKLHEDYCFDYFPLNKREDLEV